MTTTPTAAEYLAEAAALEAATLEVRGTTDQALMRSLTAAFDYNEPLPPLNIRPATRLWEPAHQHYRDLPKEREQA